MSQSTKGPQPGGSSSGTSSTSSASQSGEESSKQETGKPQEAGKQTAGRQESAKQDSGKQEPRREGAARSQSAPPSRSMGREMASGQQCDSQEDFQQLMDEVGGAVSRYCSRRPAVAVMTVFGIGFFFGWKMKPW